MRLIDADAIPVVSADPYEEAGFRDTIADMPTIDPVRHGTWLPHPTEPDWDVCSVCGLGTHRRFHYNDGVYGGYDVEESFAYCPRCGAKMDGGEK